MATKARIYALSTCALCTYVLYICRDIITSVERPLQIRPFMQNKANFRKSQMNVNKVLTNAYEKRTLGQRGKNKPNTNPIQTQYKANSKPIQTQNKAKQSQLNPTCRGVASGEAGSNPMLVRHQCGGTKAKKC